MKKVYGVLFAVVLMAFVFGGSKVRESRTEFDSYEEFMDAVNNTMIFGGTSDVEELFYGAGGSWNWSREGYILKDLDEDGTDELIIGTDTEEYWEGPTEAFTEIDAIYTMKNGKVTEVEDGRFKGYCWIAKNGAIVSEGPMGCGDYFYSFYDYKKDEMIDKINEIYAYDDNEEHYYSGECEKEISEEERDKILEKYERDRFELTPFALK